ncbi:MAG: acyl-CoA dehydrogenase family protein [Gammaproteobacteria bacterium]|nr:acyl-CoA dehydrogenase family protein [Gammaproteobacteria bacterium]
MPESLPVSLVERRLQVENLCSEIRGILQDEVLERKDRRARITAAAKAADIYGLSQPKEFGGLEAGPLESVVVHETLGAFNLCHVGGLFGPQPGVLQGVGEPLKSEYLAPMLAGEKRGAFGFTEPDDAERVTWAALEGESLIVNGQKSFVTGGATADYINAMVEIEELGPAMLLIDMATPGIEIVETFGSIDGSHHASMRFRDVRVPRSHVIGDPGRGMPRAMNQIGDTRLVFAAQSVGLMQWVIQRTTEHLQAPHRSGEPLGNKEGVRLRYADMRIKAFAARSMLYRTARIAEAGENVINEVIASKVFCTEAIGEIVDMAIQLHGGMALQNGHPLEELYRRVRAWRLAEGASDVLRLNLVRGKLDLQKGRI